MVLAWTVAAAAQADPAPIELPHGADVSCLAFSPHGKYLSSTTGGGTVRVWDLATRKEIWTLADQVGAVGAVMFLPDEQTLAVGHRDRSVRLWNFKTKRETRRLAGHDGDISALAVSPDGKWLASGGSDPKLHLWDCTTGREVNQFVRRSAQNSWWIGTIAFSPDGKALLAGGYDGTVCAWDTVNGNELYKFDVPQFTWVAQSPDGKTLAFSGPNASICLWEVATRQVRATFGEHGPLDLYVVFSPDGRFIAERAKQEQVLRLWDRITGETVMQFDGGGGGTFSPDGTKLAVGRGDRAVIWDLHEVMDRAERSVDEIKPDRLCDAWGRLIGSDAVAAHAALTQFVRSPMTSVTFITSKLREMSAGAGDVHDDATFDKLVADLDADDPALREHATRALSALGDRIEDRLERELNRAKSPEVRNRLENLLQRLRAAGAVFGEELAWTRATEVLELIGNDVAIRALRSLSERNANPSACELVSCALHRLESRGQ